jgi:hypothetical protein
LKKRILNLKIISIVLVSSLFIYYSIEAVVTGKKMADVFNDGLPTLSLITPEDSSLISNKYKRLLKPRVVFQSKRKKPVSFIYFDSSYSLIIYKIIPVRNVLFRDIFIVDNKNSYSTQNEVYNVQHLGSHVFQYLPKAQDPARKIYLALAGDSIKNTISNDTVLGYHLICKSFSIKYSENAPLDVGLTGDDNIFNISPEISTDILFLYRNQAIYLLVMIPEKPGTTVRPNILYDIVSGS